MQKNKISGKESKKTAIGHPQIYKISNKAYVKTQLYYKAKKEQPFFEVVFYNNGTERFLGHFIKEFDVVKVLYKNGKILIYHSEHNPKSKCFNITEVLGLYEILEDIFYCETQSEMLKLFDENLDASHLKNGDKLVTRRNIRYCDDPLKLTPVEGNGIVYRLKMALKNIVS